MSSAAATIEAVSLTPAQPEHLSPNQQAWRRFRRNRIAVASSIFVLVLVIIVLIWPLFRRPALAKLVPAGMTYSPIALTPKPFGAPSTEYWFGTDANGRDILSRTFFGARISLLVGVVGAAVSLVIGVFWGATAG